MTMVINMRKTIPAGEFKAKCLKIMDEVNQKHEAIVITKHGIPVAKLVPIMQNAQKEVYGSLAHTATIKGDIIDLPEEPWSFDENNL